MLVFNSPAVSNKLFTACPLSAGYQNQSVLTNCYNCLRGKVNYPTSVATESVLSLCFVYDKQHFHLKEKWAIPHSTFSFFPFHTFFFIFHMYIFSRKIDNLHGVELLSGIPLPFVGTFGIFSAQKC